MSTDKIALITGAGTGIGRAVALRLVEEGYAAVLAGRRREPLEETAKLSGADSSRVLVVPTDVGDPAAVENLFNETHKKFGRLDVLFNNAGIGSPAVPIDELSVEKWQSVVDINLTGVFLCIRQAFRLMKSQDPMGGRIINNGSVSAQAPRPNSSPYTATKHGVTGLTKSASLDGRNFNIACSQIDIGNADSDMTAKMAEGVAQANGTIAPEPRMAVADVASAVAYMASLPLDANVQFMTVMATKMPLVGRG
jgi:NAD(P)-dependent dehydrogenase (short-subunit alcohol dehydrogenase family)